jgi:hypothetical protein
MIWLVQESGSMSAVVVVIATNDRQNLHDKYFRKARVDNHAAARIQE